MVMSTPSSDSTCPAAVGPRGTAQIGRPVSSLPQSEHPDRSARRLLPYWLPRPSLGLWLVLAAATVETILLSWAQWQNYLSFVTTQGNLGNYSQAFFDTVSGHGFLYYTTNIPSGSHGSLLAVHFSPTFYALAPLYAVAPSPVTLLVLKQAAIAFAAVPIYGLARTYFRTELVPVVVALGYLVSPLATNVDWNSSDPEDFLAISLLFALFFLARGRLWPFIVCWILALGTIEAAPPLLILFTVGALLGTLAPGATRIYSTLQQERRALGVALVTATGWMALAVGVLYAVGPHGGAFGATYARRYSVLGANSLPDVVVRAIGHPAAAGAAFQFDGSEKLVFLGVLVAAGGAIWLLSGPRYWLPIAGFLAFVLLSNASTEYSLGSEYVALVVPFIFAGLVEGLARCSDWLTQGGRVDRRTSLRLGLEQWEANIERRASVLSARPDAEVTLRLERARRALAEDRLAAAEDELRRAAWLVGTKTPTWGAVPALAGSDEGGSAPASDSPPLARIRLASARRIGPAAWIAILAVAVSLMAILGAAGSPLNASPLGGQSGRVEGVVSPTASDSQLDAVLDLIPVGASVLTTNHLFPQVSSRPDAFTVPVDRYLPDNETLAQDLDAWANQSRYVAVDYAVDPLGSEILITDANLSNFGVRSAENGAVLLQRGWTAGPTLWLPTVESLAGASLKPVNSTVSGRYSTGLGDTLFHSAGGQVGGRLWEGPSLIDLPLGVYKLTISYEVASSAAGPAVQFSVFASTARVVDTPLFSVSGETYYAASMGASSAPSQTLASANASVTSAGTTYHLQTTTLNFTVDRTSYLSFPATELSTAMSIYLVELAVQEASPVP